MREFKTGSLHSGASTGPKVTNPKQAIAIALSEQVQPAKRMPAVKAPAHPHRLAGTHDGLYVTEHHRGAKK